MADPPSRAAKMEALQRLYEETGRVLNLDAVTSEKGWSLVAEATQRGMDTSDEAHERLLIVAAIFFAGKSTLIQTVDGHHVPASFVSISQLVKTAGAKVTDFFEAYKEFLSVMHLTDKYEEQLKQLERTFIVSSVMFNQYQNRYQKLFMYTAPSARRRGRGHAAPLEELVFDFGWLLFLLAKQHIFQGQLPDMVVGYHLLAATLYILVIQAPADLRKFTFDKPPFELPADCAPTAVLAALCAWCGAHAGEVTSLLGKVHALLSQLLQVEGGLASDARLPADPQLARVPEYVGGLLDAFLVHNVGVLDREYRRASVGADFDEAGMLHIHEMALMTPSKTPMTRPSVRRPAIARNLAAAFENAVPPPPGPSPSRPAPPTPLRVPLVPFSGQAGNAGTAPVPPSTPMSKTLAGTAWLQSLLETEPAQPSAALDNYFSACTPNPREAVLTLLDSCLDSIPFASDAVLGAAPDTGGLRRQLCRKLYLRVLTAILSGEEQRLQKRGFNSMLHSESFHRQLLACVVEVVVYVYKATAMAFPFVVRQLGVAPYDFCAMLETFIRYEPTLPKPGVADHLKQLQVSIVETYAWVPDSPLWALLDDTRARHAVVAAATAAMATPRRAARPMGPPPSSPMPARTPGRTPTDSGGSAPPSSSGAPPPSPGSVRGLLTDTRASAVYLELFIRKVMYVAYRRITELLALLPNEATPAMQTVWSLFCQVLSDGHDLLRGRHLDQIVMCCVFAAAKARESGLQFRVIIQKYRDLPTCSAKVYREVPVEGRFVTVIDFYNGPFIARMRDAVLALRDHPAGPPLPDVPLSPHTKHYGPLSVTVSPMRPQFAISGVPPPSPGQMTPRSRALFAFGESPARELASINRVVNVTVAPPHARARLFSEMSDGAPLGGVAGAAEADVKRLRPIEKQMLRIQGMGPPPPRSPHGLQALSGAAAAAAAAAASTLTAGGTAPSITTSASDGVSSGSPDSHGIDTPQPMES